jgi:cell wall-associated NlpC family hydrolase
MDNGGTGADGTGGGVVGAIGDWAKSMMTGLGVDWPGSPGGLFGGGASWILDAVKEAVIEIIRKSGGPGRQIVEIAKTMLGVPYLWGGSSPRGFDCSGLIWWAYQQAGYGNLMPRTGMWGAGRQVSPATARPGDVMFYRAGGAKQGVRYGHVKMYAGQGQTIESTSGGVQMRAADWGGAGEVRTYLRKGGVIIGGEAGAEGVLPLTDDRAMKQITDALGGAGGTYNDNRQINIIWRTGSGSVTQSDVRRLYAQINALEGASASAARRGRVR